MLLYKSIITVLLSTVAQVAVLAETSSSRVGQNALDIVAAEDVVLTNSARKLKKDSNKSNKNKKDNDEDEEEDEVEEIVNNSANFTPVVRSSILAVEETDWSAGTYAVSSARSGSFKVYVPAETKVGDTLFLFLSRTDGLLPLRLKGWSRGAECFKTYNRQDNCMRAAHCVERDGVYCTKFRRNGEVGSGRDLGTVLFHRKVTANTEGCFDIDIPGGSTTWAVVTAVTNVNEDKPVRRVSGTSCDIEWESKFPSVYGEKNDVLLLSQSFDDTALKSDFQPPDGTDLLGWTASYDEAGFVFGKKLDRSGQTGALITGGPGGPKCKDALLSVVVNRE